MSKYFFNRIYGTIEEREEIKQSLIRATDNQDINIDDYLTDQMVNGVLCLLREGCYVLICNNPAINSFLVYHSGLTSSQIIEKYSQYYPKGTRISLYDYQKQLTTWTT